MQLTIDLSTTDEAGARKAIAMIQAFYGIESDKHAEDDAYRRGMQAARNATAAAAVSSVPAPLAQPAATAPSTVVVEPNQIAPGVPQVTSILTPAQPAPVLPTVPAATAPTAPAAPTTHASGVAIDKAGLPWDARIHSSSKAINADGTWRKRKGLNDEGLVKRIEAELLAAMAVPVVREETAQDSADSWNAVLAAPVATLTYDDPRRSVTIPIPTANGEMPAIVPSIPAPTEVPVVAVPFTAPPLPAAPSQAPVVTMPTPPVAASSATPTDAPAIPTAAPTTLAELMPRITGAMMTGALPGTALLDVVKAPPFGIPDLPTLAHRPDLIPQVWSVLQQTYPGVLV